MFWQYQYLKNDEQLDICLKYDSNLITTRMIKMEILLFLNIVVIPSVLSFHKYPNFKTSKYSITRDDLCCEYCFKGAIDELFEKEGIEAVDSNFIEALFLKTYDERETITINIKYDSNLISTEEMKQMELK